MGADCGPRRPGQALPADTARPRELLTAVDPPPARRGRRDPGPSPSAADASRRSAEARSARRSAAVNRPAAGRRGVAAPGRGWAAVPAAGRVPVFQATTSEIGGLFPLLAANGVPAVGARMGYDALSGGAFYCHPVEWLLRGLATNPNMVMFGEPGRGKSSTVVAFVLRMMLFGIKTLISGDVKGEYTPLLRALGVTPIALGPGQPGAAQRAGPRAARRRAGTAGRSPGSARSWPGCSAGGPRCSPRWPRPRATGPR